MTSRALSLCIIWIVASGCDSVLTAPQPDRADLLPARDASRDLTGTLDASADVDAPPDAGPTEGPPPECTSGQKRCVGAEAQACMPGGTWGTVMTCPFVCRDGECTGVCVPGQRQCDGQTPQVCTPAGQWQSEAPCPYVCDAGTCAGACTPGDKQCSGQTPQLCTAAGQWQSGTACPYVCANGACTGVCVPGDKRCDGLTPQACTAAGQWQSGAACPYVCSQGTCTGVCVPGDKRCDGAVPQVCSASGTWQSGAPCVAGCANGQCIPPTCDNTTLKLSVSTDGVQNQSSITLPVGVPTKYYVHVSAAGAPCETNFDIKVSNCTLAGTGCSAWTEIKPWGNWRSDAQGVARLDLDSGWSAAQLIRFRVARPGTVGAPGSIVTYSNECQIRFDPAAPTSTQTVNLQDYVVMVPGHGYLFDNTYNLYSPPKTGKTLLQMEAKTIIGGIRTIPWRFTKSSVYAYWDNRLPLKFNDDSAVLFDGKKDLRWFIVDPTFSYSAKPGYDQYIWGYRDKRYLRAPGVGMDNVLSDASYVGGYVYSVANPVPGYNLGRKTLKLPYIEANPADGWKARAELVTIPVSSNAICGSSSCQALRMDYYEGFGLYTNDPAQMGAGFHRESWYFVKGVGLVKILGQTFNMYGGTDPSVSPRCFDASNCWADEMAAPNRIVELTSLFQNPNPLSVAVSADDVTYSSAITVAQGSPYYLKVLNAPDYTGYLATAAGKWPVWVEAGKATVPGAVTSTLATGLYEATFRVWIPDDAFANETRVSSNTLQLSNKVAVTIVP